MTIVAFLAALPGRTIEPAVVGRRGAVRSGPLALCASNHGPYVHSTCVRPREDKRKPFTVGLVRVRVRTTPMEATLELRDRLSSLLIEVDAAVNEDCPYAVCDLGYGIVPGTVIDEGALPIPDYNVLWPGKPTTNTFVEDYTWFEAFSEEGCATGIACTPAPHVQDRRKER